MKIIFLLIVVTLSVHGKSCDNWYDDSTIKSISDTLTWTRMDDECAHQYRGFRLLHRSYQSLSDNAKLACKRGLVPLAIGQVNGTFYWFDTGAIRPQKVSEKYLLDLSPGRSDGNRAALNLTTGRWHLVSFTHLFDCSLCQLAKPDNYSVDHARFEALKNNVEDVVVDLKTEIKAVLGSIVGSNVRESILNNPEVTKNVKNLFDAVFKAKESVLREGTRLMRAFAKSSRTSKQLQNCAAVVSGVIELNNNNPLKMDMQFYAPYEIFKVDELLNVIRQLLNYDENFLWQFKEKTMAMIADLQKVLVNVLLVDQDFELVENGYVKLLVANVDKRNPIVGVCYNDEMFSLEPVLSDTSNQSCAYVLRLPPSLVSSKSRISFLFLFYKNTAMFPTKQLHEDTIHALTPVIYLIMVNTSTADTSTENNVDFVFPATELANHKSISKYMRQDCWNWNTAGNGDWSLDGCPPSSKTSCGCPNAFQSECDSITSVQFMIEHWADYDEYFMYNRITPKTKKTLGYISLVGYSLSIVGLLGIVFTDMCFQLWRDYVDTNVLLHLTIAVTLNMSICVVITFINVEADSTACIAIGALFHYSLLACFTWFFLLSTTHFLQTLPNLELKKWLMLLLSVLFGWGLPLVMVVALITWDSHLYESVDLSTGYLEHGGPSYLASIQNQHKSMLEVLGKSPKMIHQMVCYPRGLVLYLVERVPIYCVLFGIVVVFVLRLCGIYACCNSRKERATTGEMVGAFGQLLSGLFMCFLLVLPWAFGFLALSEAVAGYVFAVIVSTQGFQLFVLFVCLDGRARQCCGCIRHGSDAKIVGLRYQDPNKILSRK